MPGSINSLFVLDADGTGNIKLSGWMATPDGKGLHIESYGAGWQDAAAAVSRFNHRRGMFHGALACLAAVAIGLAIRAILS